MISFDTWKLRKQLFKLFHFQDLLQNCCEDAKKCCERSRKINEEDAKNNVTRCPAKWDGLLCWDSAEPDTTLYETCPDLVLTDSVSVCSRDSVSKQCLANGTWLQALKIDGRKYVFDENANFDKCTNVNTDPKLVEVKLYVAFDIISLLFTIIGIVIFLFYKQHRIFRIQIHLNFFASLVLTSFFHILVNTLIKGPYYKNSEVGREK